MLTKMLHKQKTAPSLSFISTHAATSHLPWGDQLQHITEFGADPQPVDPKSRPLAPMLLSCWLPPVPTKVVKGFKMIYFIGGGSY